MRHPTAREIWARTLTERGVATEDEVEALNQKHHGALQAALDALKLEQDFIEPQPEDPPPGAASKVATGVPLDQLRALNASLLTLPSDFTMHRKLERVREKRHTALAEPGEPTVDWSLGEELALASILAEGTSIRLTGEDVERGTFSHRHAVFHDVQTGRVHVPLQALPQAKAAFEIHNSPLTENALIGFEYGYNIVEEILRHADALDVADEVVRKIDDPFDQSSGRARNPGSAARRGCPRSRAAS